MEKKLVWYASYGSNISRARFFCYIKGGTPHGANVQNPGCTNKTLPIKESVFDFNRNLYFALSAKSWNNGGIAFVSNSISTDSITYGYMYLIDKDQFQEVVQQELGLKAPPTLNFDRACEEGSYTFRPDSKYGRLIYEGKFEGHQIFTFTHETDLIEYSKPDDSYLKIIICGLFETREISDIQVLKYLSSKPGVISNYTDADLLSLIKEVKSWFQEISKEYRLPKSKINILTIKDFITNLTSEKKDITYEIYSRIPDELLDRYVAFSIEAEAHTKGLLKEGEHTKISKEYIINQYKYRGPSTYYFDVLAFHGSEIIGKINGYGFIKGGFFNVFHAYVNEKYRKHHIGKMLLYKMIEHAEENIIVTNYQLQTHKSNIATQKIIAELGFREM